MARVNQIYKETGIVFEYDSRMYLTYTNIVCHSEILEGGGREISQIHPFVVLVKEGTLLEDARLEDSPVKIVSNITYQRDYVHLYYDKLGRYRGTPEITTHNSEGDFCNIVNVWKEYDRYVQKDEALGYFEDPDKEYKEEWIVETRNYTKHFNEFNTYFHKQYRTADDVGILYNYNVKPLDKIVFLMNIYTIPYI